VSSILPARLGVESDIGCVKLKEHNGRVTLDVSSVLFVWP